jgi:hypothetical protein
MRLVTVYLTGYYLLIIGALASLRYGGVLGHVSPGWIAGGLALAVTLGGALFLSAGKPVARD